MTAEQLRRRIGVKVDGTYDAQARAFHPTTGRRSSYRSRRARTIATALTWRALGYDDVAVRFVSARNTDWRPFPATQAEAIEIVRELAELRVPGSGRWRRTLQRIDR